MDPKSGIEPGKVPVIETDVLGLLVGSLSCATVE